MEAIIVLATMTQKFQLNMLPDFPIVPQPSITLCPESAIKVQIKQLSCIAKTE